MAVNKKRRKIQLMALPAVGIPVPAAIPDMEQKMQMDNSPTKDPNNQKWPGKRGGRGQKEQ